MCDLLASENAASTRNPVVYRILQTQFEASVFARGRPPGTLHSPMGQPDPDRVTRTLSAAATGDTGAARDLLVMVYDELRALARARMAGAEAGQTLQPTALVHEAYLRLVGDGDARFEGRRHFFFAAARAMRDIVVENARQKATLKRGGDRQRAPLLDDPPFELAVRPDEVLALNDALDRLEREDEENARIVGLRFFVGLTNEQISEIMGLSLSTVERRWRFTRAWLASSLSDETLGGAASGE